MFIGIAGPICSGKRTIANFLIENHNFTRLQLRNPQQNGSESSELPQLRTPSQTPPPLDERRLTNGISKLQINSSEDVYFDSAAEMLDYVTKRWLENFVTVDIWTEKDLELFIKRPFFLLVSVDAPVGVRWKRYRERCLKLGQPAPSIEDFILNSDANIYSPSGIMSLLQRATVRILNPHNTVSDLHLTLTHANLLDMSRLRPSWDSYFMHLADLAARRSNCMKRRVGCVLVRSGRVISTGYNGTPRGVTNCNEGGCLRCNIGDGSGHSLSTCLCLHAEENALLEAGRERVGNEATLYCNTCPCLTCSVKIVQIGVKEVVYNVSYSMDTQAEEVMRTGGVKVRQFSPPQEGLIW